jgi:hypothetical protein
MTLPARYYHTRESGKVKSGNANNLISRLTTGTNTVL